MRNEQTNQQNRNHATARTHTDITNCTDTTQITKQIPPGIIHINVTFSYYFTSVQLVF